jgi:riboflavin kinase/FMN adenylyltransferase
LDFKGDLYGQNIAIHFVEHLRGEKRFGSVQELADQIGIDISKARQILASGQKGRKAAVNNPEN